MANPKKYGFRWVRSVSGAETPQIFTFPLADDYQPNTGEDGSGGTNCNLNVGDPVQLLNNGTVRLTQPGSNATGANMDNRSFGVVAGFPRVMVNGAPQPFDHYPGGTSFTGDDQRTLVSVIPAAGNIFEVQCDTAGGSSLDTKAEWLAVVGSTANIVYSVLTAGRGQPKANPMLDTSDISEGAEINQLRIVGLSKDFDQLDASLAEVSVQVVFNEQQIWPMSVGDTTANDEQPAIADLEE